MLCMMQINENEMAKEIKPHFNFSYGRGVIFDKDLYDFSENEILEMSPPSVWKVKKASSTNMIILTFEDTNVPSHVVFENERVRVRPFHPKPMQCFNCFKFGHTLKVCKNTKACNNCLAPEHGSCSDTPKCINCHLNHKPTDQRCEQYKYEQAAINKSVAEHISIGHAKKLMGRPKTYARALIPLPHTTTSDPVSVVAPSAVAGGPTRVVIAQPSGSGAPTPVAIAQPSGSGAQPVRKRAPDSNLKMGIITSSPSSSEDPYPTLLGGVSPPSSETPDPSEIKTSSHTDMASQAESLPDLMDIQTGKRGRPTSLSPPPDKNKVIMTANEFEALASGGSKSPPSKKLVDRTEAEIHLPHTSNRKKDKKQRGSHAKPSISRPDMTTSDKSHKSNEPWKAKH